MVMFESTEGQASLGDKVSIYPPLASWLTIERMIIFEYKRRDFRRWLALRLDQNGLRGAKAVQAVAGRHRSAGNLRARPIACPGSICIARKGPRM